ncbi:MAG: response regulator transcription factor [Bdellovibrionales bacterium]|nr:response regulator transcription factor [Bdellovibrionales bacterium]
MEKVSILLVEPITSEREALADLLLQAEIKADLIESRTLTDALELLRGHPCEVVVVGAGLSVDEQLSCARETAALPRRPAVVAVVATEDKALHVRYVEAGVLRAVRRPVTVDALEKAVIGALSAANVRQNALEQSETGPRNLPTLLEQFANRLEEVAKRLKAAEAQGMRVEANPKLVKETLLGVIAGAAEPEEKAVDHVVKLILKGQTKQQ